MSVKLQDVISQKEAAEIRGVSIQAIDYLIKTGRLKGVKVGGKTFVLRKEVEEFQPKRTGRPKKKPTDRTRKRSQQNRS
jgi:helix-turn-helix protein